MTEVLLHQLHDHLKSLRFQASLLALLLFFAVNGTLYMLKTDRVDHEVERLEAESSRRYEQVDDLSSAVSNVYSLRLGPLGTEFIAEGGSNWFADSGFVSPATGRGVTSIDRRGATNNWMDRFEVLDWALIARVVLSFLAIVLAYDGLSGERETGTLSLLLTHPISPVRILVGKFLAHLLALLAALVLGMLVSLLVLSLSQSIILSAEVAAAAGFFAVGCTLYCALFLLLSLGVSALARTSASSLVILVLVWAVLIVALPQAAYLIGAHAVPAADWDRLDDHEEEIAASLSRKGILLRGREKGRGDDYSLEREWAARMVESEKVEVQMQRGFQDLETRQYELTRRMALLSPGSAFQGTIEAMLGTGVVRHSAFVSATWQYLDTLRDFIRARDAADPGSPHILFVADYVSDQLVDHRDIPRFAGLDLSFADSVGQGWLSVSLLLLEALAAFFFATWAVLRAPVVMRS